MEVTLLYFDGCPNWETAERRLRLLVNEAGLSLSLVEVRTVEEAEQLGFAGSPTVLVDGRDPFAPPQADVGLACRVYETPDGPAGSPTTEQLRSALRRAGGGPRDRYVSATRRSAGRGLWV